MVKFSRVATHERATRQLRKKSQREGLQQLNIS